MQHLGSINFSETPTVNGTSVLLNNGNTPGILSDVIANQPAFGVVGRLFIATDTNKIYRDTGTAWVLLSDGNAVITAQVFYSSIAEASGTTTKTDANTTPVITDGTQVWSQAITPTATTSRIVFNGSVYVDHGTNARRMILALFRNSTCIGVTSDYIATANTGRSMKISFRDLPNTTSTVTYTARVWANNTGTWRVGRPNVAYYNGQLANQIVEVAEIL